MGLDAYIYCDCFETGALHHEPPRRDVVTVAEDGSLQCATEDLEEMMRFDDWLRDEACSHPDGMLVRVSLAELARAAVTRSQLMTRHEEFPILLERVLRTGEDGGEHVPLSELPRLQDEAERMVAYEHSNAGLQEGIRHMGARLAQLCATALEAQKPIVFELQITPFPSV